MSELFSKFKLNSLELKNRVVMPPMCTYKSDEGGEVKDFHIMHYSCRSFGGVGMIIVEATAVEPRGRISQNDLGLWNDEQIEGHKKLCDVVKKNGTKIGLQLAHAGRKSTCDTIPISPSKFKFNDDFKEPLKMSLEDIDSVKKAFVNSAIRAKKAGYDFVEIHAAHGYLINSFLSLKVNNRDDEYGKDRANFLKEILVEIKNLSGMEVGVRLSADSWQSDDYGLEDSITLCKNLENLGVCYLHISSGGIYPNPDNMPKIAPLYQAKYAKAIKNVVKVPIIAVGKINQASEGEALILGEICDLVAYGRALLADPNLAFKMAKEMKEDEFIDKSFLRAF